MLLGEARPSTLMGYFKGGITIESRGKHVIHWIGMVWYKEAYRSMGWETIKNELQGNQRYEKGHMVSRIGWLLTHANYLGVEIKSQKS